MNCKNCVYGYSPKPCWAYGHDCLIDLGHTEDELVNTLENAREYNKQCDITVLNFPPEVIKAVLGGE